MTNSKRRKYNFPARFLWGAAVAAHQVEGGLHNQWTVWELENARSLAARSSYQYDDLVSWQRVGREARSPHNYVSGRGIDHFRRYRDDFKLLKKLELNAFRFSIEWSRVEPEQGEWSVEAIDYYRHYLRSLKSMGIVPIVTLLHFTLPVWFAEMGGFEKRRNIKFFVRFATRIIDELGADLGFVVTINEPTVYMNESYVAGNWPPNKTSKLAAIRVLLNQIRAHKQVYRQSKRSQHARKLKLSMAHHIVYFYPGDTSWVSKSSSAIAGYFANNFTISRVRRHSDYLAVNHYMSFRMFGMRAHNSELLDVSDLGWDIQPECLEFVLEDAWERFRLPILITENGLADGIDEKRVAWLQTTIAAMDKAIKSGVRLIGYLHWSFMDNFEWDKGYWPKFGLVSVDRKTMERTVRPSAEWLAGVIRKLRGD